MSNITLCPFLPNCSCERVRKHSSQPDDLQYCQSCLMGKLIEELRLIRVEAEG